MTLKRGTFNGSWPVAPLGELCEISIGRTPARERRDFWGPGSPWLSIADMNQGRDLVTTRETITDLAIQECNCRPVATGTVLLSFKLSIGKVGIACIPLYTNEAIAALPIRKEATLSPQYLYWALQSIDLTLGLDRAAKGLTLNRAKLVGIKVPHPPVSEQRRIAEVLDRAEALRAMRRAALAQLGAFTQAIFLTMFGDPVTNQRGFPIARMGDVCDVRDGTHDTPKYVVDAGYPLVTSKNLSGGCVDLREVNCISEADYAQINKRSKVDRGDIIMPMIGTIGSPVLVDHEPNYAIKNVALVKFADTSPSPIFVHHLLNCHYFDHILQQRNRGGTQKFVSLGDLRSFPLPLPSAELQSRFADHVTAVEKLKGVHRSSLTELDALFASLQHRAFRGEL